MPPEGLLDWRLWTIAGREDGKAGPGPGRPGPGGPSLGPGLGPGGPIVVSQGFGGPEFGGQGRFGWPGHIVVSLLVKVNHSLIGIFLPPSYLTDLTLIQALAILCLD